jgi:plastocyanin/endo-1,4-beta-D-glucanase Y
MRALTLVLALLFGSDLTAGTLTYPPYQNGIRPTNAQDSDLANAYATWRTRYFRTITCSGQPMAWISNGGSEAFSEGQAYGLLMAAYLDSTSADFARLWRFYEMKFDSRGLMNWRVPGDCSGNNGTNAATDADLDAAIALIQAHRRWPGEGWNTRANTLLNNIYTHMVDGCQGLKNGDTWGGCSSGANDAYNPSYFRTGYMQSYNCFQGTNRWTAVRNRSYTVANHSYNNYALPPDWVRNDGTWGRATNSGGYGYDSCRSPWTFVQDYLWWGNTSGQNWGRKIALVFGNKSSWGNPAGAAADVGDDYNYQNGNKVRSNHENAFIGGAGVAFMATTYTAHANAFYSNMVFTDNNSYYSDSLKVIYLMIMTGAFQEPCYGPGPVPSATPTATPTDYAGTPTMTPQPAFGLVFEDFESGITGHYSYAGSSSSLTYARSASAAYEGSYGDRINVTVAAPQNWAGHGFDSSYALPSGVFDATGANAIRFRLRSATNITFQVSFREGDGVAGGDDEVWVSANTNVVGSGAWQEFTVPISLMTEDIYNTCQPNCLTTGNNTKNLASVKTVQFGFSLATAATVDIDLVEFVLSTMPSPTMTRTPFIGSYNQLFDDVESPLSLRLAPLPAYGGTFADTANGASATMAKSTTVLKPGGGDNTASGMLTYNTGTGSSYGAGGFLLSPYGTPELYVDASGAVFLGLYINAPAGLQYRLAYQEAGTPVSPTANGGDGEAWESPVITAGGGWEFIQLEVAAFNEDPYNPICNPGGDPAPGPCISSGNGIRDFQAISSVTLKLLGDQGSGVLYFDDVVFVTTFKTPTPTRTPSYTPTPTRSPTSAGTPTPTDSPTLSASPTPSNTEAITPTFSPTMTPSNSPSNTASPTEVQSPTVSPTETEFAGSPTDTPVPTQTFSSTLTVTPSATPSITETFSATHTPEPGSPTFTVVITATYTPVNTATFTPVNTATFTPVNTATYTPVSTATFTPLNTFTHTPVNTATHTPQPTATPTPIDAMITDLAFSWTPQFLTVTAGTNVTWAWVGTHDVRSDTSLFSSGAAVAGGSFNFTFNTPGTYGFYCSLHGAPGSGMYGVIYVTGGANTPTFTPVNTATFTPVNTATFTPVNTATPTHTPVASATHTPVPPSVTGCSPCSVTAGSGTLLITGSGFVNGAQVTFDGTAYPATWNSATELSVSVPSLAAGTYAVGVSNPDGSVAPATVDVVIAGPAATATPGPSPQDNGNVILEHRPFPNPMRGGLGGIRVHLLAQVQSLQIDLYTQAMTAVGSVTIPGPAMSGASWVHVGLPAEFMGRSAGTYFYVVSATRNGSSMRAPQAGRLVLMP